jgi:hypothetical protein
MRFHSLDQLTFSTSVLTIFKVLNLSKCKGIQIVQGILVYSSIPKKTLVDRRKSYKRRNTSARLTLDNIFGRKNLLEVMKFLKDGC